MHDFAPLAEVKWCHMVSYNQGTNVFRHRLGEKATSDLLRLLAHPEEAPSGNVLPYETNGYRRTIPENARCAPGPPSPFHGDCNGDCNGDAGPRLLWTGRSFLTGGLPRGLGFG